MGDILLFEPRMKIKNRYKAIAKGTLLKFTCDTCGEEIEVIDEEYPEYCPGCLREISW